MKNENSAMNLDDEDMKMIDNEQINNRKYCTFKIKKK